MCCTCRATPTRRSAIEGRWDPRHLSSEAVHPRGTAPENSRSPGVKSASGGQDHCQRSRLFGHDEKPATKQARGAFSGVVGIPIAFLAGHDRDLYVHARHTGARTDVPDLRVVVDLSAKRAARRDPPARWDYFECLSCGRFEYGHHTGELRRTSKRMSWFCPACDTRLRHHGDAPRADRIYQCHGCGSTLALNPATNLMGAPPPRPDPAIVARRRRRTSDQRMF